MRFSIFITGIMLLCMSNFSLLAQISNGQDVFNELPERFVFQVKQLDQFIKRFNSNENSEGIRINADNTSREDREKILAALFNLDLLQNGSFKGKALRFIREVTGSGIGNLSFYDKNYFATIDCHVLYKNKREELTLTMVLEGDAEMGSRWAIKGAKASFLETMIAREGSGIIPPTNHEVDFAELIEVFNGKSDISNYVSMNHEPNQLDILCYALNNDDIRMISTSTPTYHFLQIPGWIFTVDFFNRNSKNSGWLISSLERVDESGLNKYKMEKLFLLQ